ncbi:signal recognition particle-docking protein FtsY [Candidatus Cyanaurora vandensis]|uniref:signal recognition particle-docking protein FtsY n=1 Tax=Candidatus Cyanaurora vandensis TaxID=2714958 RepID=UPI00257A0DB6|nr:signal recognition particle-docking protein FtsY [Candidatus Cyanaurora vandensis]
MVFDWFKRFRKEEEDAQQAAKEQEAAPVEVEAEPALPAVTEAETVAETTYPTDEVEETEDQDDEDEDGDEDEEEEGFQWSEEILAAQGRDHDEISTDEITWLQKLRAGLGRTRQGLVAPLLMLMNFVGKGPISLDQLDELETLLIQADVGVGTSEKILQVLKQETIQAGGLKGDQVVPFLKQLLRNELDIADPYFAPQRGVLNVWLVVGVNGTGKTTTIGKLAHLSQKSGYKTLIAAADTFRAAAVEQVKVWGDRSGVEVIANPQAGTDPAAVVYDAINAALARETELLLVDTAGRLQNKKNLMAELTKIRKIIDTRASDANIEALLVLDATTGQNGLNQARVFTEAADLSGIVLTKLDGTAKGGIAIAIVNELGLPLRFIGVGEKIDDLRPFSSYEFVEALFVDL